jgi:hypothetical protein
MTRQQNGEDARRKQDGGVEKHNGEEMMWGGNRLVRKDTWINKT